MTALRERLEQLLAAGRDDALLRFSLGSACLGDAPALAAQHLEAALVHDPKYSAAWKLLGKAREQLGEKPGAEEAYLQGIAAAEARGDVQAAKEMKVFLARLRR